MLQVAVLGESIVNPTPFEVGDVLGLLLKLFFVIGFGLYVIFAFIGVRQIQIMRRTVITPFSATLQLLGWLHLFVAVLLFLMVLLF